MMRNGSIRTCAFGGIVKDHKAALDYSMNGKARLA